MPVRFYEAEQSDFGFAVPDTTYTSANSRDTSCGETSYSRLTRDTFAHHGIVLDQKLPIVITEPEDLVRVSGTYHGDQPNIAIHRKPVGGDSWIDECVPVGEDGDFSARMTWPRKRFPDGPYWFMITGADSECYAPGWSWSYKLFVRGE